MSSKRKNDRIKAIAGNEVQRLIKRDERIPRPRNRGLDISSRRGDSNLSRLRAAKEQWLSHLSNAAIHHISDVSDPFNTMPTAPPSLFPLPGAPIRVEESQSLRIGNTLPDGTNFAAWFKLHPFAMFAASEWTANGGVPYTVNDAPHEYFDSFAGLNSFWPPTAVATIDSTAGVVQCFDTASTWLAIRERNDTIMPIGKAVKLYYTGKLLDVSGEVAIACLPRGVTPRFRAVDGNGTTIPFAGNAMQQSPFVLDFTTVQALEGAKVFPASALLKGIYAFGHPDGEDPRQLATADVLPCGSQQGFSGTFGLYQLPPQVSTNSITPGIASAAAPAQYYVQEQSQFSRDSVLLDIVVACKGLPADAEITADMCATFWATQRYRGDNSSMYDAAYHAELNNTRALATAAIRSMPVAVVGAPHTSFLSKVLEDFPGVVGSIAKYAKGAYDSLPQLQAMFEAIGGGVGDLSSLGSAFAAGDAGAMVDAGISALAIL